MKGVLSLGDIMRWGGGKEIVVEDFYGNLSVLQQNRQPEVADLMRGESLHRQGESGRKRLTSGRANAA